MASANRVYPVVPPPRPWGPADTENLKDQGGLPAPATYTYNNSNTRRQRGCGGRACRCLLLSVISIAAILGALFGLAVLVYWIVVHPQLPSFNVQNVKVTGLSGTINSTTLDTSVSFTLVARNPNKELGLYYDDMSVTVESRHQRIGEGSIGGFYQGHKNTTVLYPDTQYKGTISQDAVSNLNGENRNSFPMKVKVDMKARTKLHSDTSSRFKLKVRCDLVVDLISANTPILTSDCDTDRDFRWW